MRLGARASRPCRIYEGGMEIERYSSSHEDWSGWAGLHPLSKADAVCAVPPRVPCLRMHQTGSRRGAEARRWEAQRKRASRATRQPPPGVNVSEDCERVEAPAGLPACAGATLLVRAEALPERVEAPAGLPACAGYPAELLTSGLRRRGCSLAGVGFWGSPCAPSPVSGIRTLKLPLLPLWEKGAGG